jgi:hypothetical protein
MQLRIYLIVEEGADRVYVSTTYPATYARPVNRASQILAVDVPLPEVDRVDGRITLPPSAMCVMWEGDVV